MDSITKLRAKLSEAESLLQYVSKELEGYSDTEEHLNFAELKLRGEQYSFYEHPLTGQLFRDDYLALLIYLISLGGKKEEGWTVLYRIAAACDYQGELQSLTTDAMTFTEERLSDLIREIYRAELGNIFAIDSLMISHHMGADDAQLKFLAGVYELLKLDKAFLTEAMEFVKVLDATYWDNPVGKSKPWTVLTAKDVATYIGGTPAASLSEAAGIKKNRVIIVNATHTGNSILNFDDWKPNEILFINCRFENCGGICSSNKVVKFLSCSFDQSNFKRLKWDPPYSSALSYFLSDYKWTISGKHYKELYHFENATFENCIFKHFNDATPFLYLGRGTIHGCIFEDIQQYPAPLVMFVVNNAHVSNCHFMSCRNSIHNFNLSFPLGSNIRYYTSCMIYSTNTIWKDNAFVNCSNNFNLEHMDYSIDSYVLLLDKGSHCNDCSFNNVTTIIKRHHSSYSRDYWEDCAETSIIGLHDSSANNNDGATVSKIGNIDFKAGRR